MQLQINPKCAFTEMVPIGQLKENPRNRNFHSDEQVERLALLIEHQGFRHPIIVSKRSGLIAAGHGRLAAARKLGLEQVPVDYQDFASDESEYSFLVSDNAVALWADLDLSGINGDLADLGPDFNLDLLGLENFELEPADKPSKPKALKMITCPHCDEEFELDQAESRDV